MPTVAVNPLRCRVWGLHSRLEESLTEESCRAEIASFAKHGQLIPAMGRRVRGDTEFDVELIYGARRLFVARHLNRPLLVELCEISDRDGIIAMDLENRLRQDVSAYERAVSYDRWLREGYFSSQRELASALHLSPPQVSRLIKLARLPTFVLGAFACTADIREVWGAEISSMLNDPEAERRISEAACRIAAMGSRPPASDIYKQIANAARGDSARPRERIIKDEAGKELFRVKRRRGAIVFSVSTDVLSCLSIDEIERELAKVMDEDSSRSEAACTNLEPIGRLRGGIQHSCTGISRASTAAHGVWAPALGEARAFGIAVTAQ